VKLTANQARALALIEDNPFRVEATTRLQKGFLRINGNTEHSLSYSGLITKVNSGIENTRIQFGLVHVVTIATWKLTEAGRTALRSTL
jgi:hypothetical protein